MNRQEITNFIQNEFDVQGEQLWATFPDYTVFRNQRNKKWFAIIMDVEPDKLGLEGDERIDIIDVKVDDSMLKDILLQQVGFFPGYHMNKAKWISIALDGSVSLEEICRQIDNSFEATANKKLRAASSK